MRLRLEGTSETIKIVPLNCEQHKFQVVQMPNKRLHQGRFSPAS
jgi:hypothetical protein